MTERTPDAASLFTAEEKLNEMTFEGMPLGGLLAYSFNYLHKGAYKPAVAPKKKLLQKILLKSLIKPSAGSCSSKIFYYQTGSHLHYRRLKDVVAANFSEQDYVVYQADANATVGINPGLSNYFKIASFCKQNREKFISIFSKSGIAGDLHEVLMMDLRIQLCRAITWKRYFSASKNLKLVVGDYDRGNETSPLFTAARSLRIRTIVFQHGVINPPYGFFPLIADKVCVWGEIQKVQYKAMSTDEQRVVVTGTPLIEKRNGSVFNASAYGLDDNKKKIVLGVNPLQLHHNKILIEAFAESCNDFNSETYDFYLKLHPSQKPEQFPFLQEYPKLKIWDKRITNDEFFQVCNVLITHNSGIANEALFHGIPVGILDILPISAGNGVELNKYMSVPLLKSSSDLTHFVREATADNYDLHSNIDITKFYYRTGREAAETMSKELAKHLAS